VLVSRRAPACLFAGALALVACSAATDGQEDGAEASALLLEPGAAEWQAEAPAAFAVRVTTSQGPFVIGVRREWAPHGADRFYNLVRLGFYDDQRVTRVVPDFIAQWGLNGDPAVTAAWKGVAMPDDPVRASNTRGAVAFAMTGPDTRSTQVYISLVDNSRLDAGGFAPFGRVIEGMEVVDRLYSGYGEEAGGGMRRGQQGPLEEGGNAYIDLRYPLLDRILTAEIDPLRTGRGD
jgi:homoserine O-acetyltransferase/O-succinyltransferase